MFGAQVPRTASDLLTLLDRVTSPSIVATADKAGRLAGMLQEALEDTTMDCESAMPKILKPNRKPQMDKGKLNLRLSSQGVRIFAVYR